MFVITGVVIRKHDLDGLYIGATVALGALSGGALTGASMNPLAVSARLWQAVCG